MVVGWQRLKKIEQMSIKIEGGTFSRLPFEFFKGNFVLFLILFNLIEFLIFLRFYKI